MSRTTSSPRTALLAALAALATVLSAACEPDEDPNDSPPPAAPDDPSSLAEDGSDANTVETNGQVLTSTLVATNAGGGLSVASAADLVAGELGTREVGDGAKALYFPRGCLTVAHDAATKTVTYTFAGCIGPSGLARVRGEVKATYALEGETLVLDLTATGLELNGATIDWHTRADVTASGVQRAMRWRAELSGTTARGRELSRTTDKTLRWTVGERCLGVEGSSEGLVGGRNLRTVVADFRRCQRSCPEAGGVITTTNLDTGASVELRFDGTDRATFVAPDGRQVAIPLSCGS